MAGNKVVYYWDTCLFIAWLASETRKPGEMEAVSDCIARFKRRDISLMTSVLTSTEISVNKIPAGAENILHEIMQRPNFTRISVDFRVANLARDLRNYYLLRPEWNQKTISVPDSIHLATSILYRATEFHTFDERDNNKHNWLGLLQLNGDVGGHKMTICKPSVDDQMKLAGPGFGS
ncbi:PIN domain-containing protein [Hydrocarboniphaga sp.]|uniref:type II toxin-antitoxin system VapC family toxin n=1 Tax=Hydrocarboniphaga sp. TaxID=2033016 RepID=UPI00262FAA74|nr:PIN domain-containing protein [Hydrocarboniphaga sp.]